MMGGVCLKMPLQMELWRQLLKVVSQGSQLLLLHRISTSFIYTTKRKTAMLRASGVHSACTSRHTFPIASLWYPLQLRVAGRVFPAA
jgi:hypothetical protein